MFKERKTLGEWISVSIRRQPPANYLIGGFIKWYDDRCHPDYAKMDEEDRPPAQKRFKIRVDLYKYLMEVTISNVRRN